ncbi:hypothetical protein BDB00DRAFT_792764 [Zychaea mexicana]|uniref:uncharacterized protein n=1 Tax=Zychaea mexicana TaxID=64656 RepID=UPI0022FDDE74|nr:uncharacterized protein BDB00DRAFT_792764 [Zychaea mexicana]KAI9484558.1 hypothetical protein BDB00DRAFT_792764 [Zychaea mexicana]
MQSMPYYQQGYQATASYSNNGSPVPSSVLTTAAPPMMTHTNGMSPLPHQALGEIAQSQQPPKRKQVKNACTNCQKACKKCDDARPCPRCIKYGIADTCVNSVRKERKKGIKRGPYKRRTKDGSDRASVSSAGNSRKDEGSSLLDSHQPPQPAQASHQSPYMRPPSMAFGYPSNLNQYGQPTTYDPYGSYAAAYHKDQMMPQSYVVNPMYQSMGYPVLMPGATDNQQHQPQQQQQQQQQPQQQQAYAAAQHSPVPQQHYSLLHQQSSRPFGDHPQPMTPVPSASTSSGTSTPPEANTEDDDGSKYARLSQLCTAALHHNTNTTSTTTPNAASEQPQNTHSTTDSPNPQQQQQQQQS